MRPSIKFEARGVDCSPRTRTLCARYRGGRPLRAPAPAPRPLRGGKLGKGHPGKGQYQTKPEAAKDEATGTSPNLLARSANTPAWVVWPVVVVVVELQTKPFGLISVRLGGVGYASLP